MFSSRFKWNLESNRLSQLIDRKRRAGGQIFDLTQSNPTRAGFEYPGDEILSALAHPSAMLYEPMPRGLTAARRAVRDYYRERGFETDPDRIHLTASTSEGYSFLFKLLADHGDSVLVPQPSYPLFEFLAALEGVEPRPYELSYVHPYGWRIDFESMARAIEEKTRAIILVNPNNPTGSFLKVEELPALNELCLEHNLALIVDEVFSDYAFGENLNRVSSLVDNDRVLTFVMSGLSKILALPQMKLGWIVTNGPAKLRDEAVERLDFVADTFLSVSTPAGHATPHWLRLRSDMQRQLANRTQTNLRLLADLPDNSPCRLLNCEGGWYATLEVPRLFSEEEWVLKLLEEENVLVHPGYFFDFAREAFLILSLLPEREIFSEAAGRLFAQIK